MLLKEWFGGWAETIWNLSSKTRNPRPQNPESNVHIKSNIKNKNPKIQPQTSNIQLHGLSWTTSGWDTSKVSLPCSHISSSAPGHRQNPERQPSCMSQNWLEKKRFFGIVLPLPPSSPFFFPLPVHTEEKWKRWTAANQVMQLLRWFLSNLKPSYQKLQWRKRSQTKHFRHIQTFAGRVDGIDRFFLHSRPACFNVAIEIKM